MVGKAGKAVRVLGLWALLALGLMALAPSASADQASDEYGFVADWTFAEAHEPIPFLVPSQTFDQFRARVMAAPKVTQAGAHPDVSTGFTLRPLPKSLENSPTGWHLVTKDIHVEAPPGFLGSATAIPKCPLTIFRRGGWSHCPAASQVGYNWTQITTEPYAGGAPDVIGAGAAVYMLETPAGAPARVGMRIASGEALMLEAHVRSDGDYGLTVKAENLFSNLGIWRSVTTLWGDPHNPIHDAERGDQSPGQNGAPSPNGRRPFLINPTYCDSGPLPTTTKMRSWKWLKWEEDTYFTAPGPTGCDKLSFGGLAAPVSVGLQPDRREGGVPAGLSAELRLPFNQDPNGLANPAMRHTTVELTEGLTINAAAANGMEACSEEQIGLKSLAAPTCPDGSRLASVEVYSPLLDEQLKGSMFLAEQDNNSLGALMAMYLFVEGQGVRAKVAGEVLRDPVTGQVTAVFEDNPQVLFRDMDIRFKSGDRAALVTSLTCGEFTSKSTLTPWSAPHSGPPAVSEDSYAVRQGCVSDPSQLGFTPHMSGGVSNPVAGESSTLALRFVRPDGDQEVEGLRNIKMPLGLTGSVGSVELCPDAAADVGTCSAPSRIGHIQAAVGAGDTPMWVPQPGRTPTGVYLTGPYKGAPFGLSVVVPAQAGPFDLGKVIVRSALHVDERTAQVSSGVDETRIYDRKGNLAFHSTNGSLPRILEGVFLRQREIRVLIDKPGFMVNPTSCQEQSISAEVSGFEGGKANVSERFQVGECASLGFAPRFTARILDRGRRSTVRSFNPRTRFTVVPRPGNANIGGARVALPSSTILDQSNLDTTCTRAQMAAENCPAGSVVGHAKAWSPLLRKPIEGPVYLAANGGVRPLPDIAAVLDGEVRVVLQGEISTLRTRGRARLQNTFRVVPDAPVTRFELTMRGGKNTGLLVNSTDLCRTNERGIAVFHGQNGRQSRQNLRVGLSFRGCRKVRRQAARRAAKRRQARKSAVRRIARKSAVGNSTVRTATRRAG